MLPKKQKLTKKDFSSLKGGGKSFHSPYFTLRVYKVSTATRSKFSFIISKKVSKKSVVRNRLKRIGYGAINLAFPTIKGGFSCAFFLKNESENLPQGQLSKEIMDMLKKAGVLS